MTIEKPGPWDAPLKVGPFLLTIALLIGGQVYTQGVKDAKQEQTDKIVTELRTQMVSFQADAAKKNVQDEVRYAQMQEFQANLLAKNNEILGRVIQLERSRK